MPASSESYRLPPISLCRPLSVEKYSAPSQHTLPCPQYESPRHVGMLEEKKCGTSPYFLRKILNPSNALDSTPSSSHLESRQLPKSDPVHLPMTASTIDYLPSSISKDVRRQMANDDYLRRQLSLPPDVSVNLWAIAEVPGERPSVPLPILIKLAIHGSPEKKLTLQGICHELAQRFSWFKQHCRETAWKNSIRHNLSLNKVFRKIPLSVTQSGKGSYWQLDFSDGEGHKRLRKRGRAEQSDPQNSDSEQHHSDSRSHGSGNSPQPYRGEPLCPPTAADGSFGIMPKSTPDPTRDEPYIDPPARQNDRWK